MYETGAPYAERQDGDAFCLQKDHHETEEALRACHSGGKQMPVYGAPRQLCRACVAICVSFISCVPLIAEETIHESPVPVMPHFFSLSLLLFVQHISSPSRHQPREAVKNEPLERAVLITRHRGKYFRKHAGQVRINA